jgi:hypothetical protein
VNKLGIIILNWNGYKDTIECINSISSNEEKEYAIFLLDNGSSDESVLNIEKWLNLEYKYSYLALKNTEFNIIDNFEGVRLIFIKGEENLGFAKGNNYVINKIKDLFEYILLLNNDTVITKNALSKMVDYLDVNKNTGAASCDIRYYSDHTKLWNAGGKFTFYGDRKYYRQEKIDEYKKNDAISIKSPFITGCALMIRREILKEYGLLTENFFFGEEDYNYCKRLEKNMVNVETILTSTIYHKISSSIKKLDDESGERIYNNYILHFSNRIIDHKEFYSYKYWLIWRIFYMIAIMLKVLRKTKNLKIAKYTISQINYYSKNFNGIDYRLFKEIKENRMLK